VYERQRNFSDTAANEAQFWRNVFHGTRPLSGVQIAGVFVLAVAVLALVVGITIEDNGGSLWQNALGALIRWVLAFGILGAFLILFGLARELERRRAMKLKDKAERPNCHSTNAATTPEDPKCINTARTPESGR